MSANLLLSTSRFLLFGPSDAEQITLKSIVKRKAVNVGRSVMGMPPVKGPGFWELLKKKSWELWCRFWYPKRGLGLPEDMPERVFTTVDGVLRNRGGVDKNADAPNFWAVPSGVIASPFFWSIRVEYSPHVDPSKLFSFELSVEDQLARSGFDYNVRMKSKPLRIEIDKPKPPVVTLEQLWDEVAALPVNERQMILGQCWQKGKVSTLAVPMVGEDFSAFIAGSPGSGKTQLSMTMLLSLAMTNSPESLGMIIVDPKAIDFRPYATLPHLCAPIITEPLRACEIVQLLVDEMDSRTKRAAAGDVTFLKQSILLYVDELSDLLNSLSGVESERLAVNLQRLAQKGRGVGFVVMGATQRVYDIPASTHSKLNMRVVGKMRNANDSVSASGVPGTVTNKLPGKGSFELFSSEYQGLRIQAPFVAASDKQGYEGKIGRFIADIQNRWVGKRPNWTPGSATVGKSQQVAEEPKKEAAIPVELFERLAEINGEISGKAVRRAHLEVYQKDCNAKKAARLLELFNEWSSGAAIKFAES